MITAAYILIALTVMATLFRPLFSRQQEGGRASRVNGRRRQLLEEREIIYETIRDLDFDYRMGKVEEDDYHQTRARYESQAIDVLKAIDGAGGRMDAVEDRVEQEIAGLRRSRKRGKPSAKSTCPNCGAGIPKNARFCHQCGTSL